MILFFDTETTGFIAKGKPDNDPSQPHLVQLAAILTDNSGRIVRALVSIVAVNVPIPQGASDVHGITTEYSSEMGEPLNEVIPLFTSMCHRADVIVAHNISFDKVVINKALSDCAIRMLEPHRFYCTMKESTDICKIPHTTRARNFGSPYKWPKLAEAYKIICGKELVGAHDALNDVRATMEIYFRLKDPNAWFNVDKRGCNSYPNMSCAGAPSTSLQLALPLPCSDVTNKPRYSPSTTPGVVLDNATAVTIQDGECFSGMPRHD